MRGRAAPLAVALLLTAVPPLAEAPAAAAVGKTTVVKCRPSNRACWPTAFAFTPDGRSVFFVERFSGQVRRYDLGSRKQPVWARIRGIATSGEQGLLGIAVDPGWPAEAWVYVYYTARSPLENRIVRFRKRDDGSLVRDRLLTVPAAAFHNGGVIHFGPDGMLYAVTGDAGDASRSQDPGNPGGKVLRMNRNGSAPADNPFARRRAFSIGHRNSFGFAFDPRTGRIWQTENGPECNDEVNLVAKGANYGWGPGSGCPNTNRAGPNPVAPRITINPVVAPTGAAFCDACGLGAKTNGSLLFGSYLDRWIRRLRLTAERRDVVSQSLYYRNARGVLAVEAAPGGAIFFSDTNGIYRLRPG